MKRLLPIVMTISLLFAVLPIPVKSNAVTELLFSKPNIEDFSQAIVAIFDENKVLISSGLYPVEQEADSVSAQTTSESITAPGGNRIPVEYFSGDCKITLPATPENAAFFKIIFPKSALIITDIMIKTYDTPPSPAPTPTAEPASTMQPLPAETPSASPTLNPVYPREVDAVTAFAVVQKISRGIVDDEPLTKVDCLYQGKEITVTLEDGVKIATAPDAAASTRGADVSALQKGDVIYFIKSLGGPIRTVHLIYRPQKSNILTSNTDFGTNFEKLFAENNVVAGQSSWAVAPYGNKLSSRTSYAFGLIQSKGKSSITLFNKHGKESEALSLPFEKTTVVYTCDMAQQKELAAGTTASIQKSSFSKASYDNDGNIIHWDESGAYAYALVRIVDGTITDMIVYLY